MRELQRCLDKVARALVGSSLGLGSGETAQPMDGAGKAFSARHTWAHSLLAPLAAELYHLDQEASLGLSFLLHELGLILLLAA